VALNPGLSWQKQHASRIIIFTNKMDINLNQKPVDIATSGL